MDAKSADAGMIRVELVYARPERQLTVSLQLAAGSSVKQAIAASGLLVQCPEIDLAHNRVGIFSRLCSLEDSLHDGDRIEIYRPLLIDPKEARRLRAAKKAKKSLSVSS